MANQEQLEILKQGVEGLECRSPYLLSAPVYIMDETGRGHEGGVLDHQDILPRDLRDQRTQVYFVDIFQGEFARAKPSGTRIPRISRISSVFYGLNFRKFRAVRVQKIKGSYFEKALLPLLRPIAIRPE